MQLEASVNPVFDDEKFDPETPDLSGDDGRTSIAPDGKKRGPCSLLGRFPTAVILVAAGLGLGLGIVLSNNNQDIDPNTYEEVVSWLGLPGDLFLRALKCIVLPLVFVNIILAVREMLDVGDAISIGWKTIAMYTLTTVIASVEGLIVVLVFKQWFATPEGAEEGLLPNASRPDSGVDTDISMSQTIQDGIFRKMVSKNIVADFANNNFLSVIVFGIVFAVASHKIPSRAKVRTGVMMLVEFLEELNEIFLLMINWIIAFTPIAVFSLVCATIADKSDLAKLFQSIGVLIGATVTAMAIHFFVAYPGLYIIIVKESPLRFLAHLVPAQAFAFASASSAATLPTTMKCVEATGMVPTTVRNFVLSLGATINMDGGAIYFPTAIVFLAMAGGKEDELNAASYILIILLSTIGSAGTAPVPSASLVLIITAYNTVFGEAGEPAAFASILAIDWLMDRFRTTLNVTGDAIMTRLITALASSEGDDDATVVDEHRFSIVSETIEADLHRRRSTVEVME